MAYKSKFFQEREQQENAPAAVPASTGSGYKSKFFQSGGNLTAGNIELPKAEKPLTTELWQRATPSQTVVPSSGTASKPALTIADSPAALMQNQTAPQLVGGSAQAPTKQETDGTARGDGFGSGGGGFGSNSPLPDGVTEEDITQARRENAMQRSLEAAASYREDPTKYLLDTAAGKAEEAVTKLQEAQKKVESLQAREQELTNLKSVLDNGYATLQGLLLKYQTSGSDVDAQSYLLAAQQYEAMRTQFNEALEQYQKDATAYDQYNSALERAQKAQTNYEKARENYLDEHLAEKYAEASPEEIYQVMQDLRSKLNENYETASSGSDYSKPYFAEQQKLQSQWEDLNELYKQKLLAEDNGLWGSGPVAFADRALTASEAGQMDWFAGMANLDRKAGNAVLRVVSAAMSGIADMTGNDRLKQKSQELLERSHSASQDAEDAKAASLSLMQDALTGTGKLDGWIIQQFESMGAMWMDLAAAGATGAMGLPSGASSLQIMGTRAAGSAMLDAQEKGYSEMEQLMVGAAAGGLEVLSEKLFGGNPLYDTDKGLVNQMVEKVTKNQTILRLMYSKGFDIMGEGLEEVFTEILDPVAEWMLTDSADVDWASPEEVGQAFLGGVFLGLVGQGTEVAVETVANSGVRKAYRQLGAQMVQADAVQEVVAEGLAADQSSDAYQNAVKLQKKLDAGKEVTVREIGKQLMANQEAIEAGLLVDQEVEPVQDAPEGALKDPEAGFYAIQIEAGEDGKQTFRLVEVAPDGSISYRSETATTSLFEAKMAAEIQGLNIRQIGTSTSLRAAVEEKSESTDRSMQEPEVAENEVEVQAENEEERIATAPAESRNDIAGQELQTEPEGIQWAGNMPEALNGGIENGTEQQAAEQQTVGDSGNQERVRGNAAGQAARSPRQQFARDALRRAEEARRVQSHVQAVGGELVSLREQGLSNGSTDRTVWTVPKEAWTTEIQDAAEIAESEGLEFIPLSGAMYISYGKGEARINGAVEEGKVFVQTDSTKMDAREITMHEVFHEKAAKDPTLVPRLVQLIQEKYTKEQTEEMLQRYYDAYQEIYSGRASDEALEEMIWEEMLADAYAEFQRFLDADASKFGMDVQEAVWSKGKEENAAKNVRFSLEGHEDDLQDILDQGIQQAATMESVREMDGTEFEKRDRNLTDQVSDYFDSIGNKAVHPILGEVVLDKKGAKADIAHGIGRKKAAAFLAVPDVVEKGGLIDYRENWKSRGYDTAVLAAPVKIADQKYLMGVVLERRNGENQFYVHEILAESNEGATPFWTGTIKDGTPGGDAPSVISLLQKIMNVKRRNVRSYLGGELVSPREKKLRNESRFSLSSPVEQTDTLIALHNMTEEKLKRTLELGSWPAPSIAIVRAEQGHENFGEYSAVFPRSTIDPEADTRNKVYGSDAWTPTHNNAQVEYEVNYNAKRAFENKIYDLSSKFAGGAFKNSSVIGGTGVHNETNMSLDEIAKRLAKYPAVQEAYLQNRGDTLEPVYKAKNFDSFGNEALQRYIDSIGYQELARQDMELTLGNELSADIMEAARNIIIDEWVSKNEWRLKKKPELREARIEIQRKKLEDWRVASFIQHAWEYYEKYGENTDEIDTSATGAAMFNMIMPDGSWEEAEKVVQDWVRPQLEGILGETGIYNGTDRITDNGRRSFRETHYPYSAENIVRAMFEQGEERGGDIWNISGTGLVSTATPEYRSVEDIHSDEARLKTIDDREYEKLMKNLDIELKSVTDDIMRTTKRKFDSNYEEEQNIGSIILQVAKGNKTTAAAKMTFRKEGYAITGRQAREVLTLLEHAGSVPTGYFEAKPQRVVEFEEAIAVLAPNDAPVGLIDQMREAGMNVVIYQAGDEKSRLGSINRLDGIRFSVDSMDTKQTKEDKARARAERELAKGMGEIMSMPQSAVRELQEGIVRQIMEEYQQTGEIDQEKLDDALSEAFAKGLMVDDEFYQQYKPVKDYLRSQALTISEQDRADIADFTDFRKRAFGTLRIVNNGGLPVDVAYQELQGMAPELFPMDITSPADQLMKMYEVCQEIKKVQVPLERALGENADEFFDFSQKKMNDLVERTLEKYAKSVDWKPAEKKQQQPENRKTISQEARERFEQADQEEFPALQWAGQEEMEGYTPQEQPQHVSPLEQAANGTMRDWIQFVLGGNITPEEFAEMNRNARAKELTGRAKEKTERIMSGKTILNSVKRDEMTDEEVAALIKQFEAHRENAVDRNAQTITPVDELVIRKADFTGTPAMEKLGIKIDGSVARYRQTKQLKNYEDAAYQAAKMLNKRIRQLKATEKEKELARLIVDGTITEAALDSSQVDVETVAELADYYMAANSFKLDMIAQRRAEINTMNYRLAQDLFRDAEVYTPQLRGVLKGMTKLVMNERTPERVVKQIFGQEQGGKIYETYFRPVWVNGAEMSRFESRMLDRVREFRDKDGKTRALTVQEREFAQRLMEGQAAREAVENLEDEAKEKVTAVAQNLNNGADFTDQIREWGMADNEYLQGLAQAYADYLDTVTLTKDMDQTILQNAIQAYSQAYNELYEAVNDFLVSHGYKPIGFIPGYAPHFQKREVQQGLFGALKSLGVEKESVSELPASIAGRTADFKPNMKWNPHFQSRKGEKTSYDIAMGYEQYIHYVAEMFYHTDDVMRIRQAVNYFRQAYSSEDISQAIEDAQVDQFKDVAWKKDFLERKELLRPGVSLDDRAINAAYEKYVSDLFDQAKPENLRKYSEFVTWMDNYANIVAGKQSIGDRSIESDYGRTFLNIGNWLMKRFTQANVAGNLSSVLNQTAQVPLIQQQLGKYMERAMWDMARGTTAKENFAERSDFLTDKRGVEKLTTDNAEKFISTLFKPAEMMDRMVSTLAVRGRYLQALDQGMTMEQAMKEADDFGRRVMGSRMKGAKPVGYEDKRLFRRMIHVFQVEASNTFDYMALSDMPQAVRQVYKTKGKAAGARYLASYIVGYLLNAFLLNQLTDKLYGGTPAPFDLMGWALNFVAGGWGLTDEEFLKTMTDNGLERIMGERPFGTEPIDRERGFSWAGSLSDLGYNVSNDLPYVRNVAGVLGLGDQSLPTVGINEFIESLGDAGSALWNQTFKGQEETGLTWAGTMERVVEDLLEAGAQIAPGGRQLKKTAQGVKTMVQGGVTSGYGDNQRLKYPVEQNVWNWARGILYGNAALDEYDAYYASGNQPLTAGQTQKVKELEDLGIDRNISYNLYQEFREINSDLTGVEASTAKRNAINDLDLTDDQKLEVFDRFFLDHTADNYEATRAEYQAMLDAGLTWNEITEAHNEYAALEAEVDMKATEKATALTYWVDQQGWNEAQIAAVKERYQFWSMMPAEAANYEKFTGAGLQSDSSAKLTEILSGLTPEDGKETVSANQKILAIQGSDLSAEEKVQAIAAMSPERRERLVEAGVSDATARDLAAAFALAEAENGDEELADMEKARTAVDMAKNNNEAMAALSTILPESTYGKLEMAAEYGVTAKAWVNYREARTAAYGSDSVSQEKVETVLDKMNLTERQKAALWQIANKSWKPANNPYSVSVGEDIFDLLNEE